MRNEVLAISAYLKPTPNVYSIPRVDTWTLRPYPELFHTDLLLYTTLFLEICPKSMCHLINTLSWAVFLILFYIILNLKLLQEMICLPYLLKYLNLSVRV